jgi:hypothetical protein
MTVPSFHDYHLYFAVYILILIHALVITPSERIMLIYNQSDGISPKLNLPNHIF